MGRSGGESEKKLASISCQSRWAQEVVVAAADGAIAISSWPTFERASAAGVINNDEELPGLEM